MHAAIGELHELDLPQLVAAVRPHRQPAAIRLAQQLRLLPQPVVQHGVAPAAADQDVVEGAALQRLVAGIADDQLRQVRVLRLGARGAALIGQEHVVLQVQRVGGAQDDVAELASRRSPLQGRGRSRGSPTSSRSPSRSRVNWSAMISAKVSPMKAPAHAAPARPPVQRSTMSTLPKASRQRRRPCRDRR